MNVPDSVFQDGKQWYFWDETGTQFLGPFHSELDARDAAKEYGEYLSTGVCSPSLARLAWKDGENTEIKPATGELRDQ